ncbi:MAG: cell division protein FtsA [Minisyncoccota bacterium]
MARHLRVGIDIGTHQVKVIIAEELRDGARVTPRAIGTGTAETKGLQKGYIVDVNEVSHSVRMAADKAEKMAGVEIKRAFVSVGGVGLGSVTSTGSVAISRADLEVTTLDIDKAHEAAEASIPESSSLNRKIINSIPLETKLDNKLCIGRVEGMRGGQLQVKVLFITCLEHHLEDLIRSVEGANIEVIDVVASPIASSFVTISKKQKRAGCLLLNIGAETMSLVTFENSNPLSLEVFDTGGNDLTNDIALGLKTTLEEAESIKLGSFTRTDYPKKKLDDIVSERFGEMFELVESHLKKIGRQQLLPAGIVLTGGGSGVHGIKDFAESVLKLPARVAEIHFGDTELHATKDLPWSVAYGLAVFGFNTENERDEIGQESIKRLTSGGRIGFQKISDWIGKILP